jgi:hypothetical protein
MGGPPPPAPPGTDKEAERPAKIKTSFAHTRGRKGQGKKHRKYGRLPNMKA